MNVVFIATLISFIAATGWFWIVYRMDKHEKEPIGLIAKVFFAGFALSLVAGIINSINMTLFGERGTLMLVGFVEEGAKFLAVWWIAFRHKEFNAPIDGVVYASAAALGFAFGENINYNFLIMTVNEGHTIAPLLVRSFTALLHVLIASIWGYGLGYYKQYIGSKGKLVGMWLIAAIVHSAYDLATGEMAFVMLFTFVVLGIVFIFKMKHLNRISPMNNYYLMSCPYCATKIKENSLYCSSCGEHIFLFSEEFKRYCKTCQEPVGSQWKFCTRCGSVLLIKE